jgi:hypothetical protein
MGRLHKSPLSFKHKIKLLLAAAAEMIAVAKAIPTDAGEPLQRLLKARKTVPAQQQGPAFEPTVFTTQSGLLTKRISLAEDGAVNSDGSACRMASGTARRAPIAGVNELAALIEGLESDQAIVLGALRQGLPDEVKVVTKVKLKEGAEDVIARTAEDVVYRSGQPAFALIDTDSKGMPDTVAAAIERAGGIWQALVTVLPDLEGVARVERRSTSSGLSRSDTGEELPGSANLHIYLAVMDGADIERFLKGFHERCWLAGFGWLMVSKSGALLERSPIDRMVFGAERLVFEGAPLLIKPIRQDQDSRQPVATAGVVLDTSAVFPPLTIVETAKFKELLAKEEQRLAATVAKVRAAYVDAKAQEMVARKPGMSLSAARQVIEHQCEGILLPDVVLPFDDDELAGCTVGDVLADPERFINAVLADPNEGVEYGATCAKVLRRPDGSVFIKSFAHGGAIYHLKLDAAAVRAEIEAATKEDVVETFVKLVVAAELSDVEEDKLRKLAIERSGAAARSVTTMIKEAKKNHTARLAKLERKRLAAARNDPRPEVNNPEEDAPWLDQMGALEEVLHDIPHLHPPERDIDSGVMRVKKVRIPNTHAFTKDSGGNAEAEDSDELSKLPPPEQYVLCKMNEMEAAEMIEKYIDFVDPKTGKSVHLRLSFVRHFMTRDDKLPLCVAVSTLPIVLADGVLLAPPGLDRLRGIEFYIPDEVRAPIPDPKECNEAAVREAMQYLCDVWLCDVNASFANKCIAIALALTLIERSLLDERPAFFVTAGHRGGGKTTLIAMLIMAVLGVLPAAAAWSTNEEERRKALLSYFLYGMAYILWDNIARGSAISCPHIEKSCTAKFYIDRKLGVSEATATAASSIHIFTGNNIGPKGELASRSLSIRINVDRTDPENRDFKHPDPVGWTDRHRGQLLRALYTILLGNPQLKAARNAPGKTRFKMWWRLVGSAVEHAAGLLEPAHEEIDFQNLFVGQEEADDEDALSLADTLEILAKRWPNAFHAKEVTDYMNGEGSFVLSDAVALREFLFPGAETGFTASVRSTGKRLTSHIDEPVKSSDGERTLILRKTIETSGTMKNMMRYPPPPAAKPPAAKKGKGKLVAKKGATNDLSYE